MDVIDTSSTSVRVYDSDLNCQFKRPTADKPCTHYMPVEKGVAGLCELPTYFRCVEAMKRMLPPISHSAITQWASCKMKYYWHYVMGLNVRPIHAPRPMVKGLIWDAWQEQRYTGKLIHPDLKCETTLPILYDYYDLDDKSRAQLNALTRAFDYLEIKVDTKNLISCQYKIHHPIPDLGVITGYTDRAYDDHIVETKLSARPDYYNHIEGISHQAATYFLGNKNFDYIDMEVTRLPDLRTGTRGRYENESTEAYEERVFQDIMSRPSYYFIGFNRSKLTFGKRFWRGEFDLDYIERTFIFIMHELRRTIDVGSWYRNEMACFQPTLCMYYPIKQTGVVSEELYYYKQAKEGEEDR